MSAIPATELAMRVNVACTNEECTWRGQRKRVSAEDAPCPKCSSAVVIVPGAHVEPVVVEASSLALTTSASDVPAVEWGAVDLPFEPAKPWQPFSGVARVELADVRVGAAAKQRLAAMQRQREHRHRSLGELASIVLDRWGAGLEGA